VLAPQDEFGTAGPSSTACIVRRDAKPAMRERRTGNPVCTCTEPHTAADTASPGGLRRRARSRRIIDQLHALAPMISDRALGGG